MSRMPNSIRLATAALAVLSLAGCRSAFNGAKDAWSAQGAHPITVETHLVSDSIAIDAAATDLSGDDRDRVAGFAADYHARGIGKLSIAAPEGGSNKQAAMQMEARMTNIALEAGVDPRDIEIAGYRPTANQSDAPIVVSYSVYQAIASACGNWTRNYAFAPLNHDTPDHGCATQNNLAVMVENPRDLIVARDQQAGDQGRRATVLDQYRKGAITSSQKDDQATGAVSEVNK